MKYFLDKFKHAFKGIVALLMDKSVLIQEIIAIIVILFFYFGLQANFNQMLVIILLCGLVIVVEMLNTCIEKVLDFIEPKYNLEVKKIKDMSAGAVLFVAMIAMIIGIMLMIKIIGG